MMDVGLRATPALVQALKRLGLRTAADLYIAGPESAELAQELTKAGIPRSEIAAVLRLANGQGSSKWFDAWSKKNEPPPYVSPIVLIRAWLEAAAPSTAALQVVAALVTIVPPTHTLTPTHTHTHFTPPCRRRCRPTAA